MVSLRPLWIPVLVAIACHFGAEVVRAGDAEKRAREKRARAEGDASAYALCLAKEIQSRSPEAIRKLITASNDTLNAYAEGDRIVFAKDHRPSEPRHLRSIRAEWQQEAEYWYNHKARELKAGDQFVTHRDNHRWTKVIVGPKEVWRGPDGLLVGDVVGQMTHYDAQRVDRALKRLYDQAIQVGGEWRWPEGFDPKAFLKHEMEQRVSAADLPGVDIWANGSHDVVRFFKPLMASIGEILEPYAPWRLPIEWSALRGQGAQEVLNNTSGRWFWSSLLNRADSSGNADGFYGNLGYVDSLPRYYHTGSVRFVARVR